MAGIIGLMPAMIVGLIVQLLWDIVVAIAKGNFILIDFFFVLLLLAFGAGLTWFNLRENIADSDRQSEWLFALIISPLIGLYVRKRMKRKDK